MWYTDGQYTTSFFAEGAAAVDRVILHCDLNNAEEKEMPI